MSSLIVLTSHYKKVLLLFLSSIRIHEFWREREFWRQKNLKSNFHENKKVAKIDDIDFNKILVSKEEPYSTKNSFKHFIRYNDNDIIRPLCIKIP